MRELNIAIFNSFPFHHEVFGFIIAWCKDNNHKLTIYTEENNNCGFFSWYDSYFGKQNYEPYQNIYDRLRNYDIIFITTDDDPIVKEIKKKSHRYNIKQRLVNINHIRYSRSDVTCNNLFFKPHENNLWNIPVYKITYDNLLLDKTKIHILCAASSNIWETSSFKHLYNRDDIVIHICGRNTTQINFLPNAKIYNKLDANDMINIIGSVDYFFGSIIGDDDKHKDFTSGFLPLAINCGTPIILDKKTADTYDEQISDNIYLKDVQELKLKKKNHRTDAGKRILHYQSMFDDNIKILFPQYYKDKKNTKTVIPKIIHQVWLSETNSPLPSKYNNYIESFKYRNPDYEYKIWYMSDSQLFVQEYFPQYYEQFKSIKPLISRCDILRFMVVYIYGGIYVDLDFECRRNLDMLICDKQEIFIKELPEHERKFQQLYNGCFASVKYTDFIKGWIDAMFINCATHSNLGVMKTTGPVAFWIYYSSLYDKPDLDNTCNMTPYTDSHVLSKVCTNSLDEYMRTYWNEGTSWGGTYNSQYLYIIILIVIIFLVIWGLLVYYNIY